MVLNPTLLAEDKLVLLIVKILNETPRPGDDELKSALIEVSPSNYGDGGSPQVIYNSTEEASTSSYDPLPLMPESHKSPETSIFFKR